VLPGAGAAIASFMAYGLEKRVSKHPEKFGTGVMEGVAAPEGANNAAACGAMVPLLTLGIPGSGATAVMLGALMIHGLRPGPLLFTGNPEFVWGLIASMYIGNVMLLVLNMPLIGMWVQMLKVPNAVLLPVIIMISTVGIYAADNSLFDLWIMLLFGAIGYAARKMDYPLAPMVLGLILGPLMEMSLRQSMVSYGSLIFLTRPIAGTLMMLGLLSFFVPLFRILWNKYVAKDQAAA
jgi:putative tricarboxylic transport membrane protein